MRRRMREDSMSDWRRKLRNCFEPITSQWDAVLPSLLICYSSKQPKEHVILAEGLTSVLKPLKNSEKGKKYSNLHSNVIIDFNWQQNRFELNADEAGFGLAQFNLRDTILSDTCPAVPSCDESTVRSPFRTADGSCNNLRVSSWGKSRTQFQRALVANYADGKVLSFFSYCAVWKKKRNFKNY